jgi:hypothetical protein
MKRSGAYKFIYSPHVDSYSFSCFYCCERRVENNPLGSQTYTISPCIYFTPFPLVSGLGGLCSIGRGQRRALITFPKDRYQFR